MWWEEAKGMIDMPALSQSKNIRKKKTYLKKKKTSSHPTLHLLWANLHGSLKKILKKIENRITPF